MKSHWRYLWVALILATVEWIVFKWIYPYPNLVLDSYYYIKAAVLGLDINVWPIGYSRFLSFYALFSHSHFGLVTLQFAIMQVAFLCFFYASIHLFKPGKLVSVLVFCGLFCNPLIPFCANLVMADSLFISLSLLWLVQLIWIIYRPRRWMILSHGIVIFCVFTVRYNALYYPFVSLLAFGLSRQPVFWKITGVLASVVLIGLFMWYTTARVAAVGGSRQFSPFGGWKLANDALYAYSHVAPERLKPVPDTFKQLDKMVQGYFSAHRDSIDLLRNDMSTGSLFMFDEQSPLLDYMYQEHGRIFPYLNTPAWTAMGAFYQEYGLFLIQRYPGEFVRYFAGPNLLRWLVPLREVFGALSPFYLIDQSGGQYTRSYFGVKEIHTADRYIEWDRIIFIPYPLIFALIHLIFILGLTGFLIFGGFRKAGVLLSRCLFLVVCLWGVDLCFSVLSAGIVMRYQIFMIIVEMAFGTYFLHFVYVGAAEKKISNPVKPQAVS